MKTEREVEDEIRRLAKCYTHGKDLRKDHVIRECVKELKWVISPEETDSRKQELYENLSKMKGIQKTAFNAIRRYEIKSGTKVTLKDIQSDFFVMDYLVGFGEKSRQEVLKNPKLYLY